MNSLYILAHYARDDGVKRLRVLHICHFENEKITELYRRTETD